MEDTQVTNKRALVVASWQRGNGMGNDLRTLRVGITQAHVQSKRNEMHNRREHVPHRRVSPARNIRPIHVAELAVLTVACFQYVVIQKDNADLPNGLVNRTVSDSQAMTRARSHRRSCRCCCVSTSALAEFLCPCCRARVLFALPLLSLNNPE
jgi:hypothetical protein